MAVGITRHTGEKIPPSYYGLSSRTELRQTGETGLAICIYRKSRIIMKDGLTIVEKAKTIRMTDPDISIDVETTAPVCSKTRQFLLENNVGIVSV